jgi:CheY-like chemotaxis protein
MAAPGKATVVVDDDLASATAVARLLAKIGCRTRVCTDAPAAVALALAADVDLVTLDLGMPGLDGYEVLTLIRSHEQTRRAPSVPVLAITGRVSAHDRALALAAGFAAHLAKPVTLAALRDGVERALLLRSDAHRARYSVDRAALEERTRAMAGATAVDPVGAVAAVAAAVESRGEELLGELLRAAYASDIGRARLAAGRLATLAGEFGALRLYQLVGCCTQALDRERDGDLAVVETAVVLARAEVDRVVYTLREQVLA